MRECCIATRHYVRISESGFFFKKKTRRHGVKIIYRLRYHQNESSYRLGLAEIVVKSKDGYKPQAKCFAIKVETFQRYTPR